MAQPTPFLTAAQWCERLHAWAVERWGEARAQALGEEIDATAQHLVAVLEYPLEMEHMPAFFLDVR